jgi:hypothetical protein
MKKKTWFLLLLSFSLQAQPCPKDQKLIATEFLKEEFYGRRLYAPTACFKQEDFSWIQIAHDPPNEEALERVIVKTDSVVVEKVEMTRKDPTLYTAQFKVKISRDEGETWVDYSDSIHYMKDQNKAGHCALLLQSPEIILISSQCSTSDKD